MWRYHEPREVHKKHMLQVVDSIKRPPEEVSEVLTGIDFRKSKPLTSQLESEPLGVKWSFSRSGYRPNHRFNSYATIMLKAASCRWLQISSMANKTGCRCSHG